MAEEKELLPEKYAKELSEAYQSGLSLEDPEERQRYLDALGRVEKTLQDKYSFPEGHKSSLHEGIFKAMDLTGGAVRSAAAIPAVVAGKMSAREGLAGLNPTTTQMAPVSERLLQVYGVPEMGKMGSYLPAKEDIENLSDTIEPGSSMVIPSTFFSKEGPLKNVTGRFLLGLGLDVASSAPKAIYGKVKGMMGGAAPAVEKAVVQEVAKTPLEKAAAIQNVITHPVQKVLEATSKIYKFPKADLDAIKAGKGSTGQYAGNILETPFTDILAPRIGVGGSKKALRVFEDTLSENGKKAADLVQEAEKIGQVNQLLPKSTRNELHAIPFDEFTGNARRMVEDKLNSGSAIERQKAADVIDLLDTIEGKKDLQFVKTEPKANPVVGLDPTREVLPKAEPEYVKLGEDLFVLNNFHEPVTGATYRGMSLSDVQKLKQHFQNEVFSSWKTMPGKPKSDFLTQVEKQIAKDAQLAVEKRVDTLIPEAAGELKKANSIYGTLLSGEKGFVQDVTKFGTFPEQLAAMGLTGAGVVASNSIRSPIPAFAAAAGIAGKNTQMGRSVVGVGAKKLSKLPLDATSRAAVMNYNERNLNPYEALLRQRERAGMTSRKTFKEQK